MSRRDIVAFEGPELAWKRALAAARLGLDDLDLVETHDCFTIAELIEYEAMGLTPKGEGARAILEGWTEKNGRLPVNPSGGLKSKGHPIGATGVSMHVLAAMQVTGKAGDMQIPVPGSPGSSTWAAPRSPISSASSSRCGADRTPGGEGPGGYAPTLTLPRRRGREQTAPRSPSPACGGGSGRGQLQEKRGSGMAPSAPCCCTRRRQSRAAPRKPRRNRDCRRAMSRCGRILDPELQGRHHPAGPGPAGAAISARPRDRFRRTVENPPRPSSSPAIR